MATSMYQTSTSQMLRMFHVYSEPFHLTYMEPVFINLLAPEFYI